MATTPGTRDSHALEEIGTTDVQAVQVSVVIPCLNEADTIEACVHKARRSLDRMRVEGEVIVADNGSTDGSQELAAAAGATVVHQSKKGYGNAYLAGFAAARGEFIVMGDGDDTYNFDEVDRFVEPLMRGADMVMGNRFDGRIHKGAMPWHHRWIGNPVLTGVLNVLYRSGIKDAHCGMRSFRRDVLPRLDLRTPGMEFASEMVIRAAKENLDIVEIPIELRPRGGGEPKLSSFRDGWRHLRFLLVHSPTWLFIVPGAAVLLAGLIVTILLVFGPVEMLGRRWDIHVMIAAAMLAILGSQVLFLGIAGRTYGLLYMGERDPLFERAMARVRLEHGLLAGAAVLLVGLGLAITILVQWIGRGFGQLGEERLAILSLTLIVIGGQAIFASFFLSILGLRKPE